MNLFIVHLIAHLVYKITKVLRINNKNSLRVIIFHDIKKKDFQKIFRSNKINRYWSFVDQKT